MPRPTATTTATTAMPTTTTRMATTTRTATTTTTATKFYTMSSAWLTMLGWYAAAAAATAPLGRSLHYGVPHYLYNALLPSPTPSDVVCLPMPRLTIVCNFCALNLKDYFWLILQQNAARLLAEQWNTRAGRRWLTEEASRLAWYGTTIGFGQVCWGT